MTSPSLDISIAGAISSMYPWPKRYDYLVFNPQEKKFSKFLSHLASSSEGYTVGFVVPAALLGVDLLVLMIMGLYWMSTSLHVDWVAFVWIGVFLALISAVTGRLAWLGNHIPDRYITIDTNEQIINITSAFSSASSPKSFMSRYDVYNCLVGAMIALIAISEELQTLAVVTGNSKFFACAYSVDSAYGHVYESFKYTELYASDKMRKNNHVEWLIPVAEKARKACDLANVLSELSTRSTLTTAHLVGSAHIEILLNEVEAARLKLEALDEVSASSMLERGSINPN